MTPETALAEMELAFLRLRVRFACHEMNNLITQISGQATLAKMALARGEDITDRMGRLSESSNDMAAEVRQLHQAAASETAQVSGASIKSLRDEARSLIRSGRGARDLIQIASGGDGVWEQSCSLPSSLILLAVFCCTESLLTEVDDEAATVTFSLEASDEGLAWVCCLADHCEMAGDSLPSLAVSALAAKGNPKIDEMGESGVGTGWRIWLT